MPDWLGRKTRPWKSSDYSHPQYRLSRVRAFERSGNICQFCGQAATEQAHHWAENYPAPEAIESFDLTALCGNCHSFATALRRYGRENNRWLFKVVFRKAIELCFTRSVSQVLRLSSCTAQQDLTLRSLPMSKRAKSRANVEATAPKQTTSGSSSSNVSHRSGSTAPNRLPFRQRLSVLASRRAREN